MSQPTLVITTASNAIYTFDGSHVKRWQNGERADVRASAWANVELLDDLRVGEHFEFAGWPGELRGNVWSPWCARGEDHILTTHVRSIEKLSDDPEVADAQLGHP